MLRISNKERHSVWQSRFGRRLFIVFLLTALVPVVVLSALTIRQINLINTEQSLETLRQDAKLFGLGLYDRLLSIENEMGFYSDQLRKMPDLAWNEETLKGHIEAIEIIGWRQARSLVNKSQALSGGGQSDKVFEHLSAGNAYLFSEAVIHEEKELYVLMQLQPGSAESEYMLAKVRQSSFWGDADIFAEGTGLCVLESPGALLFCNSGLAEKDISKNFHFEKSKNSDLNDLSEIQQFGWWRLFLKARFQHDGWIIILSSPQESPLTIIRVFQNIYVLVGLLLFIIVFFMSAYLIRKSLRPMEVMVDGIKDLSENKFRKITDVHSRDEFETIIRSFNSLTETIHQQITTMRLQSRIDRSILTRRSLDEIMDICFEALKEIGGMKSLAVGFFDEYRPLRLIMRGQKVDEEARSKLQEIDLWPELIGAFRKVSYFIVEKDDPLFAVLSVACFDDVKTILIVPVIDAEATYANLLVGFDKVPEDDLIQQIHGFADRLAVAYSQAAWEDLLYHQAHNDMLTGLPNRTLLLERLNQEIERASRKQGALAVLFLDLDRFKNVNDSLGHNIGDLLLQAVSQRLVASLRQGDMVARLSGDEFVVVVTEQEGNEEAVYSAITVSEKIIEEMNEAFRIETYDIRISTSIGISLYPNDGEVAEQLLQNADSAMYHAKEQGPSNFYFYSQNLNEEARARLKLEAELFDAFEREEFIVHFQPIWDATTGELVATEALIRWQHPDRGTVYPGEFIEVAATIGLLVQLERIVIQESLRAALRWREQLERDIPVAVNISSSHIFHGNIVEGVESLLSKEGTPASLIQFEVTETVALYDINQAIETLNTLSEMGCSISIDDFGTGYSSMGYVKDLPAQKIKIDRSFISGLPESNEDLSIIKSIVALGKNLSMQIVAEGVENESQLRELQKAEVDYVQGFLFSRAVTESEIVDLVKSRSEKKKFKTSLA